MSITPAPVPKSTRRPIAPPPPPAPRTLRQSTAMPTGNAKPWGDVFDTDRITALVSSKEIIERQNATRAPIAENDDEYDGPAPTGKTLADLAKQLGAPESASSLIDEMQEAMFGIIGDLTSGNNKSAVALLSDGNRMRGLGAILVLVGVVGILIESLGRAGVKLED